ncbi:helix-turn-helix domain-containing protein [uncultured Algibacter sp.]|uniref:helix-turn-helix domain-containing protein n=1 Tax=uncultured Algibacter sp. TaxID=298659 RepID=UPI00261134F4|nr:helix-turn-helix domain-containing protein [uncultured Algibacter sp.]
MNFNVFNIIILIGIILGFLFSLIILFNKKLNTKTNRFLILTILALSFSNLQYWFIDTGLIPRYKYENNTILFIPFEFLILPFFFLFIKSYLNRKIDELKSIYLFIPFVLSIVYLLVRNLIHHDISIIKIFNTVVEYISIFFSIAIIILIFKLLSVYKKEHQFYDKHNVEIKTNWLSRILNIGILLCLIWFISLSLTKSFYKSGYYYLYPLWIGMSILIYWIAYTSIKQKKLYQQRKEIRKKTSLVIEKTTIIKENKENSETSSKIHSLLIDTKLYLDPSLSLKILSEKLHLSEGYISQLINKSFKQNFNDYVNLLRVEEAKKMLINLEYDNYTIVAIGLEAGFNSKSSFYTAFKKHTGKTPSEYKKEVRNL